MPLRSPVGGLTTLKRRASRSPSPGQEGRPHFQPATQYKLPDVPIPIQILQMKGLNKYEGSDTISWSDETLYDLDFCLSKVGDMPLKVDLDNLTYGSEHNKSTLAYTAYASRILKKLVVHDANNEQKIYACGELLVRWLIWLNPRIARPQDRPFKAVKLPQSQKHSDGTFTHKFELNTKYTGYFCQHSLLPKDISGQFVHPFESLTGYTVVLSPINSSIANVFGVAPKGGCGNIQNVFYHARNKDKEDVGHHPAPSTHYSFRSHKGTS